MRRMIVPTATTTETDMTIQTMTLALVLSLATPLVAYAEDTHPHVDCGKQNAQMSSMTAEEKAQMQAECAKQKQSHVVLLGA